MFYKVNTEPQQITHLLEADGNLPNNPDLPLVVYGQAFLFDEEGEPEFIERKIIENTWGGNWRNGIYPVHHYHSIAHEVLGVYAGSARVQFGGESGPGLRERGFSHATLERDTLIARLSGKSSHTTSLSEAGINSFIFFEITRT